MSAAMTVRCLRASGPAATQRQSEFLTQSEIDGTAKPPVEYAFYRKYTEGMLRRYMYQSMEIGRMPSMLGNFTFRGRSSSRKARSFEDCVIFVHDVENCLKKLDPFSRELVGKIALQEYTQGEAAEMLGISIRTVVRRYADALDRLTAIFLELDLMQVPGMM